MKLHKLKVTKNSTFDHHVKVRGKLDCGRKTINQVVDNNTAVTINSTSGIIIMNAVASPSSTYSFNVINDKVSTNSVILLSLMNDDTPILYLSSSNVTNGMFTLNVNNPNGAPTGAIHQISFLASHDSTSCRSVISEYLTLCQK